jgi:hypothetical protein
MSKPKRATAGERIMCGFYSNMSLDEIRREDTEHGISGACTARRIDSAIRRAVREAWEAGRDYENSLDSYDATPDHPIRERIERKYGVKL